MPRDAACGAPCGLTAGAWRARGPRSLPPGAAEIGPWDRHRGEGPRVVRQSTCRASPPVRSGAQRSGVSDLTFGLAAGAGLTVTMLCLMPNCQKSRRSPSGHSPGQLQPGLVAIEFCAITLSPLSTSLSFALSLSEFTIGLGLKAGFDCCYLIARRLTRKCWLNP